MTARTLFVKIFLWFWLANTVVISALALVVWMYPFAWRPHPGTLDQLHGLQVRGALAVRDSKGLAAFEQHARELEEASGFRTYWLDESGKEARGGGVPEHLVKIAQQHEPPAHAGPDRPSGGPPGPMVIPMTDARGDRYWAVAEPQGPGPTPYFQELFSSRVFALRVLAVVLTAGLGCYALARYLTSPVRRLQHAAQQLASGDLSVRVDERLSARRDELGELGRDFDRMAGKVEVLLTSQKRLLQDVSHELRSPLARLNVALELASQHTDPGAASALARVGREAERLNELIGQLLTLARLEGTAAQSQRTLVDLRAVVSEVAADADFEATARGLRVRVGQCDDCETMGLPDLLRSAIENVVRNALHYTAEGTEVAVTLCCHSTQHNAIARIEIRDHGPGVPEDALRNIFQPFYRVSGARERQSGGAGLGLAIADRAIQLHGGSVRAANAPDGGLTVQIELPCA